MTPIPTIPSNVNLLDFVYDTNNDYDVVPIKRTQETHKSKDVEGYSRNPQMMKKELWILRSLRWRILQKGVAQGER